MALDPLLSIGSPRRVGANSPVPSFHFERSTHVPPTIPNHAPNHIRHDSELPHQADYWQSRCNDLKKLLSQVQADLQSALERERSLTERNTELESRNLSNDELQEEVYALRQELARRNDELRHFQKNRSDLQKRLDSALRHGKSKEDRCENLQHQIQSTRDELDEIRKELAKEKDLHHRSTAELRAKLEGFDKMRQDLRAKERDLENQEGLCHEAVSELNSLRHRMKAAQKKEAQQARLVELLQSEKDLWLSRCEDYKKQYYESLRHGLHQFGEVEKVETLVTATAAPTTPPTPPWRRFSRSAVIQT